MDHAEVRAWLEEAFFRPGALRRVEAEGVPDGGSERADEAKVRQHLLGCADCSRELRSLRVTSVALDVGLGPPPAARQRTLAKVHQIGRERRPGPAQTASATSAAANQPRRPARAAARPAVLRWAAALLVVLIAFGSGALLGLGWPGREEPAGPRLENAAAMLGDLMSEPDSQHIQLLDTEDEPAGLVVHSVARQQLAVLSSTLEPPAEGGYDCYLERDGQRTLIGPMHFDGETAFWAGPVGGPADAGRSGDRFLILHDGQNDVVLWGQF